MLSAWMSDGGDLKAVSGIRPAFVWGMIVSNVRSFTEFDSRAFEGVVTFTCLFQMRDSHQDQSSGDKSKSVLKPDSHLDFCYVELYNQGLAAIYQGSRHIGGTIKNCTGYVS